MKNEKVSSALRCFSISLLIYLIGSALLDISGGSEIGAIIGLTGYGVLLTAVIAEAFCAASVQQEASSYRASFCFLLFTAVMAAASAALHAGEQSRTALYAAAMTDCLFRLGWIVSVCMTVLGTAQLLRRDRRRKTLADEGIQTAKRFMLLASASVILDIVSSMMGSNISLMSAALVLMLVCASLNLFACFYCLRFLLRAAKALRQV